MNPNPNPTLGELVEMWKEKADLADTSAKLNRGAMGQPSDYDLDTASAYRECAAQLEPFITALKNSITKWRKEAEVYARQTETMRKAGIDAACTAGLMSQLRICAHELDQALKRETKLKESP